jgi:phosphoglycolate phosphatase
MKYVFFDLDGTLVDTREGIFKSLIHVLESYDIEIPPDEDLIRQIGPPLHEAFSELLDTSDEDEISLAIDIYRRRYSSRGLYQSSPYPGIEELLRKVRENGLTAFVLTAKMEAYAKKILDHYGLSQYFVRIYGSRPDGSLENKSELISYVLEKEKISPADAVMIGDREYDITGAKDNGFPAVAVTYGYGSREEIAEAGPARTCDDTTSLYDAIISLNGDL